MQPENGSSTSPNRANQTGLEIAPTNPSQIILAPLESGNAYTEYNHVHSKICGAIQIMIGVLSIVFSVIDISSSFYFHGVTVFGPGIGCGLVFIVTGSFGVAAGIRTTKCKIIAFMVLCIVSAALTTIVFGFGIFSNQITLRDLNARFCWYGWYCDGYCQTVHIVSITMQSCLAILAVTEACVAIWGSTVCCRVMCCGAAQPVAGVLYRSDDPSEKLLFGEQGQPGLLKIQPNSVPAVNETEH